MTDYPYTLGVPNPPNSPSVDVPNMQINTNSIAGLIGQDHVGFQLANGGYHTVIHSVPNGGDPGVTTGFGQIYTKSVTSPLSTDQQLFYESGGGVITQLTSYGADTSFVKPNFGYASIAGAFIIQWGIINTTSGPSNGTYTFTSSSPANIAFPTRCANVSLTLNVPSLSLSSGTAYVIGNPGPTSFAWQVLSTSSQNITLYWTAIGF